MTDKEHGIDLEEDTDLDIEDAAEDAERFEDFPNEGEYDEKQREAMESDEREREAEAETNPDNHRDDPSQVS